MERPGIKDIKSGKEFNRWYWLKEEMVEICKYFKLPYHGRKFDLRDRIMYALDNNGDLKLEPKPQKKKSNFNWSRTTLTTDTIITDNVSFGPNFRRFMKKQIGDKFSCHSDFMDWVKSNTGKTLQDAIIQWFELEKRKSDPTFKRVIADNNMYAQYCRDFMEDNPNSSISIVKKYWLKKKKKPTDDGFIRYEKSDLDLIKDTLV